MESHSVYLDRPDLLELPYFWRLLFARQLSNSDTFEDATKHFGFRCTDKRPKEFAATAERKAKLVGDQFASHFVFLTTPSKWRVGRTFHNCPEDNTISFDLVSPTGCRTSIGSDWGSFFLPALRWTEIEKITSVFRRRKDKAQMLLMLLPGIGGDPSGKHLSSAVLDALKTLDFASNNLPELAAHLIEQCFWNVQWTYDRSIGWTNDSRLHIPAKRHCGCVLD